MRKVWRYVRWPLAAALVVWLWFVVAEINWPVSQERSDAAVAAIHAQRLTMADVDGSNLPPEPDPAKVNATIEGVDANDNGIRDDVELALFKRYPINIKIRAADLQYLKALQYEMSSVFDSNTLVAAIQQEERAYFCIASHISKDSEFEMEIAYLDGLVFNTQARSAKHDQVFRDYMTSYGGLDNNKKCDID